MFLILCSFLKYVRKIYKQISLEDVEDFFQKNDYLSKFAGEKRKGGRKKLR